MHFVIMGCGRVGASLATQLELLGHEVAVVDQNPQAFRRLPPSFEGTTTTGLGFDRDTLTQAGIQRAFAFAAVSNGDNSNILAARVARETFGIEHVVARIYDARRAEVYQRLGIPTVATVSWATDQIMRRLLPAGAATAWTDPSGQLQLTEIQLHRSWVGLPIVDIQRRTHARVAVITRLGVGIIPTVDTVFQEGDLVHFLVRTQDLTKVEDLLAAAPRREEQ